MNGQQLLNYIALAQGGGSVFMLIGGIFGKFDAFLFIGNLLCVIGNCVWVWMIYSMRMNDRTMYLFAALAVVNLIGLAIQTVRCRRPTGEDDSDGEDEADQRPQLAAAQSQPDQSPKKPKTTAKQSASMRKRRQTATPDRAVWSGL